MLHSSKFIYTVMPLNPHKPWMYSEKIKECVAAACSFFVFCQTQHDNQSVRGFHELSIFHTLQLTQKV